MIIILGRERQTDRDRDRERQRERQRDRDRQRQRQTDRQRQRLADRQTNKQTDRLIAVPVVFFPVNKKTVKILYVLFCQAVQHPTFAAHISAWSTHKDKARLMTICFSGQWASRSSPSHRIQGLVLIN